MAGLLRRVFRVRPERRRADAPEDLLVGPIGGELLGADHLAARARVLARAHRLAVTRIPLRPARLLARLSHTRRILSDARARLTTAAGDGIDAGPAAEWLLDNHHVVQEHLQEVRASLPGGFYRELPELASGPLKGYPRVYEIAIALISHTEARVDLENVELFVDAFQSVTPLTLRELWAMPAMLRLGLIESVRRMTLRTVQRLDEIELASWWAGRLVSAGAADGRELREVMHEFAESEHALTPHFVSCLLQSLRQAEGASPSLRWLEHWLRDAGASPEQAVTQSTQRLALTQIMMANSITSLRDIGRRDWRLFVERQSAMEAVLRRDPSGHYTQMTFATRDRYRHVVERIAKRSGHGEPDVAQWAIDLARKAESGTPATAQCQHVGYYLIDDGVRDLERLAGYTARPRERAERWMRSYPNHVFIGGLATCTVLATFAVLLLGTAGMRPGLLLILLFSFGPAVDIAAHMLTQLVTAWFPPHVLPRLDFHEQGIPAPYQTVVVIPTLFGSVEDVLEALDNVEVQFLANREAHLHFAILSDFLDAPAEQMPGDSGIVSTALKGVHALNRRHAADGPPAFSLFHRARRWNEQQGTWMGWERKRGKLAQFNQLLRHSDAAAFATMSSDPAALRSAKYVITLDADTVLPPDAAPALVGAMAHPLNHAVYDTTLKRVVRGFGILQPRVGVSLPSAHKSRFAAIASGHPGVDPYAMAVSDVYQDLFGEGSYTGKGIYDIDIFEQATHGRFPDNTLLSHDLIEGNYARAGLATDVIVYDNYPSSYVAWTRRKHRWLRGDWQLLPWLGPMVPGPNGPERNQLSWVSRWKILDNMRRSLVEVSQLLLLVAGWTILPGSPLRWTLLGVGAVVAPWITAFLVALVRPPFDNTWRAYYRSVAQDAAVSARQAVVALTFLPHQAWISLDAIVRTLHRLYRTRRQLLEWRSAALVERSVNHPVQESWRSMRGTVACVLGGAALLSAVTIRQQLALQLPLEELAWRGVALWSLTLLWTISPGIAARISTTVQAPRVSLSVSVQAAFTRYARAHWEYFDHFVTPATHALAPDNVQFDPEQVVAMRTSPTNIGLQLLATVSAHDLGFISATVMTERLEASLRTLVALPRYRGHFYNWYDLRDLRVLDPPYISTVDSGNIAGHLVALRQACVSMAREEPALRARLDALAVRIYGLVADMDFSFLYEPSRKLFTIGYHPESFTADASFYDLLASEARLASFMAIARNDAPVEHWFRLSRALNRRAGSTALVSWSGSMFEYLMPLLVMRSLPFTLLDESYRGAVERQMAYGKSRGVPWGVSESAYNLRDRHDTYQYHAFGVADLGLKRGLDRDLVIAPYATALAALVAPERALANLQVLEGMGALGPYGFVDAIDYTRPAPGQRLALVNTCMAHHVGMSLVAFTNVLCHDIWQERFHADPLVKSAELLLHERVPRRLVLREAQQVEVVDLPPAQENERPVVREVSIDESTEPRVALLGAAPYTVMLNHNGSGSSRYESLAVTRWRADRTRDDTGQFCYVRDMATDKVWSAAHQPVCAPAEWSRTWLAPDRVTMRRLDGEVETRMEIVVVPADSAEVRRVTVTNLGSEDREVELTSYGEVVLATPDADRAHPAFSNLFVETEWHAWCSAITVTRRPRLAGDRRLWCVHVVDAGRDRVGSVSCETDRGRFLGRGRGVRNPQALESAGPLSGTTGAVLDPIVALRTRVHLAPGQSANVAFTTLIATSRQAAFELADRYHDPHAAQRALDLAWSSTQIELRELGITTVQAALFQDLAGHVLFAGGALAPPRDEVRRNRGSQPQLWTHGISGDLPIVLATIDSLDGISTLRELFAAHRYWRHRGLEVDLVVVNAHPYDYLQELRDAITDAMVPANDRSLIDQRGGVFPRRRDAFRDDDYLMLSATSRAHVLCDGRPLSRILARASATTDLLTPDERVTERDAPDIAERPGALAAIVSVLKPLVSPLLSQVRRSSTARRVTAAPVVRFANGIGGLDEQNHYRMVIDEAHTPPAPWVNVIANAQGGFIVSERGTGCTWAENSYFYRLTPWHNDPVSDPASDIIYLQDPEADDLWSATPAPVRSADAYIVTHAPGTSTFEHQHNGIQSHLTLGLADDAAVRISLLQLTNTTRRPRHVVVTAFAEWTLGAHRETTQAHVHTTWAGDDQAMLASNHYDPAFADWTAFLASSEPVSSFTADRRAFIGPNGTVMSPAALRLTALDGASGSGLDPCAALQIQVTLGPGESRDIALLLGAAKTEREARRTLRLVRTVEGARRSAMQTVTAWQSRLRTITVTTPEPAFDALVNTWTLYQALSSRMWGRMALYQSSGAYGFRDQLQDVLALLYAEPALARAHILRAASRQFVEGDVQHWWHAHTGRGVRTRFSDDLAWLPYVVDIYVRITGDTTVLDESVPFIAMRALEPHEHELYDLPTVTDQLGSVYEHCVRALQHACTRGAHGLPLIGTGDWNDGMSRVGADGKGESVWLAWFLVTTLRAFATHAESRGDAELATWMRTTADAYVTAVEGHGWDGQWYTRAFYDDGTALGSASNDECRIDSIAQSWSVISGAGSPARQALAMHALNTQLVREDARLIMLLTPPFDRGLQDPGYIKGYLPGVRENGAQYTHAALWAVMATALQGDGERAFELYQMCNPLTHTATPEGVACYKAEPYVVAADVYTAPGQLGRGGWSWYTGSASWMYRIGLEQIVGLTKTGNQLRFRPCTPKAWPRVTIVYRFGASEYTISLLEPAALRRGPQQISVDGTLVIGDAVVLVDDGSRHEVVVQPAPSTTRP